MSSEEKIREEIEKVIHEAGFSFSAFSLTEPDDKSHGDFATNIAFLIAKEEKNSPKSCADKYAPLLQKKLVSLVYDTQVAGPGFINFFLKPEVIRGESKIVGQITTKFTGKKVLVEHSSPNLFKPFHIGHLMNNIVGEFLTRGVSLANRDNVTTLCFPSDISFGIAKAVSVLLKEEDENTPLFTTFKAIEYDEDLTAVVTYLGDCYVRGTALLQENPTVETAVREVSKKLYDAIDGKGDTDIREYKLWSHAHAINTRYFETVIESIGSKMGKPLFESEVSGVGKEIVMEHTPDVFTLSEGAVVYIPDEERKDINTSVFVNSEGHPTYEAKDLGLIDKKFSLYPETDLSFFVTDAEQSQHFKVVLDAASKLGIKWEERVKKSIHVPHGRMLFKGQKMSSRLGGVPLALDVISVVEEEVRERAGEKIANLSQEEKDKLTREIALSALRVAVLRSKPGININFDPETSLSFEGDSGPYLLYTHARCSSLLEKGKDIESDFDSAVSAGTLERTLLHFNETFKESIEDIAPQKLVTYLFRVAQEFNSFYAGEQILTEDKKKTSHNLAIVLWTKEVLKQGLYVLGITATERM